mmetsp:Transcript_13369/g.35093  ORF Transcript_13369/g.35093 Transcript_13369/m.35093 type:complete len:87 (-) Transcript_13369:490-750(-)
MTPFVAMIGVLFLEGKPPSSVVIHTENGAMICMRPIYAALHAPPPLPPSLALGKGEKVYGVADGVGGEINAKVGWRLEVICGIYSV